MENQKLIKLGIADDHKIFRDGIKMALSTKSDLSILWEAENGKSMMQKIGLKKPDVLLMDIRMPEIDGINAIKLIREQHEDIKIIVLSMYDDEDMISKMMEMGANAYLTKTTDPEEIHKAIITCMNDDYYFNDMVNGAIMGKLMHKKHLQENYGDNSPISFNEKELRILKLLAEDKTSEEISKIVSLSPRTVEAIRQNMKNKVEAKTLAGLISYAIRNKLIN